MAQEQFAGPEHYVEFDPEKFIRDLKIQSEMDKEDEDSGDETAES